MKAIVVAFNKEKVLVGAFSVIVNTDCETDGSSAGLVTRSSVSPIRPHQQTFSAAKWLIIFRHDIMVCLIHFAVLCSCF